MIPPDVEERFRAHVSAVMARSHVPARARDDLAEELYGHLVESFRELVAAGVDHQAAADRAVRGFGRAERIGRALTRAYRGRFFASTIGVLLPAKPLTPGLVSIGRGFLAWMVALTAFWTGVGAIDQFLGLTPMRALVVAVAWACASLILLLTTLALQRGQRWALHVSVAVCVLIAAHGAVSLWMDPSSIPLTGVAASVALGVAWLDRRRVVEVTRGGRAPRMLVAGSVAAVLAAFSSGPLMASIEDPTQASTEELDLSVRVRCDTTIDPELDAEVLRWTVDVFWEWSHVSVLPSGFRAWHDHTDTIVLRHPGVDDWVLADTRPPEEAMSRRPIGWQGSGPPSAGAVPRGFPSAVIDFAIRTADTHAGIRYQAAWVMHSQSSVREWPAQAEAWYFHGDQWSLAATAACDETRDGEPPAN